MIPGQPDPPWTSEVLEVRSQPVTCVRWSCPEASHGVVAVHGFGGHPLDFESLVAAFDRLGVPLEVVAPTLGGHGRPGWVAPEAASPVEEAERLNALGALLRARDPARSWHVLGYSMGGRIALQSLLLPNAPWERAAWVGASRGYPSEDEARARVLDDEQWAQRLESEGMEAFERAWAQRPAISGRDRIPSPWRERWLARRLEADPHGLAASLRRCGTGRMAIRDLDLAALSTPTLAITGALDEPFVVRAQALARCAPGVIAAPPIPGAGHAAHAEQPGAVAAMLCAHLAL